MSLLAPGGVLDAARGMDYFGVIRYGVLGLDLGWIFMCDWDGSRSGLLITGFFTFR